MDDVRSYYSAVLGALLHDIGKLLQRSSIRDYVGHHQEVGARFVKERICPPSFPLELASYVELHHEPGLEGSGPVFSAVVRADRLSAGERLERPEGEKGRPSADRLIPILAEISFEEGSRFIGLGEDEAAKWGFPLAFGTSCAFPEKDRENEAKDYDALCNAFEESLKVWHRCYEGSSVNWDERSTLESFTVTLLALLKYVAKYVPSAAYGSMPDISLYSHLRVAAALAGCLLPTEDDKPEKPFLYIHGDISGIQNFIYSARAGEGEAAEGFSKRLRGRSLYVSLLTDGVARFLLHKMKLSEPHLLLSGGGNFSIIAPNSKDIRDKLQEAREIVEKFLWDEFGGRLGLCMVVCEATEEDIKDFGGFYDREVSPELERQKRRKLNNILRRESLVRRLEPKQQGGESEHKWSCPRACPLCDGELERVKQGKDEKKGREREDQEEQEQERNRCALCELHEKIGRILPKAKYLFFVPGEYKEDESVAEGNEENEEIEKEVVVDFGDLFTWVLSKESELEREVSRAIRFLIDFPEDGSGGSKVAPFLEDLKSHRFGYSFKVVGKYIPTEGPGDGGVPKTFEEIAKTGGDERSGPDYLGIVRMDVDDLGAVFSIGLGNKRRTLSRIIQLSEAIDDFFSVHIVELLRKEHEDVYLGYSGGDDLFFVARWDEAIGVAQKISDEFKKYCCGNPALHLSSGVYLSRPKYPVAQSAKRAGDMEDEAKKEGKDSFCVFGRALGWDKFAVAESFRERVLDLVGEGFLSKVSVHKLLMLMQQYMKRDGRKLSFHPVFCPIVRMYLYRIMTRGNEGGEGAWKDFSEHFFELISRGDGLSAEVGLMLCALQLRERKEGER